MSAKVVKRERKIRREDPRITTSLRVPSNAEKEDSLTVEQIEEEIEEETEEEE